MKKSKFSEEQIATALRQVDAGAPVPEVTRTLGISEATYYVWCKRYGQMAVAEIRRLRQLEEENRKLKQLVADLTLAGCGKTISAGQNFDGSHVWDKPGLSGYLVHLVSQKQDTTCPQISGAVQPAAMGRSGIAVRCSALLGFLVYLLFSTALVLCLHKHHRLPYTLRLLF